MASAPTQPQNIVSSTTAPDNDSTKGATIDKEAVGEHLELDPVIDKRLDRKFDLHILPFLFGIWLFSFIDRSNIGNAAIAGLRRDLDIQSGTSFNVALLVFYATYIAVDVPSNWIIKRVRAGVYLPALITAWGVVCTCMGFVKSFSALVACRLLLGLFEGGILGGVIIYLAMFYRRHQMVLRCGLFYSAAPLSGAFVEGAMTVVFGMVCFFFMPNTPGDSRFLTPEEREHALRRMREDASGSSTIDVDDEKFNWHWVKMALMAPQTYLLSLLWFFLLVPLYSFSLFLPTIIFGMGYTSTTAQLLTAPPNMTGFVSVIFCSYLSDRFKVRGPFIAGGTVLGIIGYAMLLGSERNPVKYAGTFFIGLGVFQCSALMMGWCSNNLAPHYVRATGVGVIISLANCSAFIGTFIYLSDHAPRYILGHAIALGALCLTLVLTCVLVAYLRWENGKRERGERDDRLLQPDSHRLGHRHPRFKYTL
ncbi:hypothetical protein MCOR31_011577 [Pyricularia oryzae]|nr:hypothetical protein MCOR28_006446 [Pyricularia oryzae]KAI6354019.1 hypothetical protein MCOR31_011577 [Pyricularia oryzae]KAI6389677.1 hypothetical protein MCOR24_010545 [Pyricularia oryzae]KAI6442706.1 hypothetical protein MCOR22_005768 [Pyricularia oryzae]KAI6515940.1 hypothetical protein MCOR10_007938 [Pyricularia oryzae]